MNFSNFIYIDPSISTAGDGSTPANALKDFPSINALVDDTMYILRRTADTAFANVPTGSNSSITRLGIVGMPLSDDGMFDLMPEEAKTAWGSDTATKAQLRVASSDCDLSACYDFFLYNVNLERTETYSNYYGAFYFRNTTNKCSTVGGKENDNNQTYYGTMSVVNCRFAGKDEALDSNNATALFITGKGQNYIYHEGYVSEMNVRNNVFCFSPSSSSYGTSCIMYCNRIEDNLNISGNKIYSVTVTSDSWSGSYYFFYFYNSSVSYTTCRIIDNGCVVYPLQNSDGAYPTFIQMYDSSNGLTEVRNFSYVSGAPIGGSYPSQLSVGTVLEFHANAMGVFENITVELPKCWKTTSDVIYIECNHDQYCNNGFSKIDGITVTMADDGIGEKTTDSDLFDGETKYYQKSALRLRATYTPISNISVWNPYGAALMIEGSTACDKIGGVVALYNYGYVTLNELTCYRKYALFVRGGGSTAYDQARKSTVIVNKIIMNAGTAKQAVGYTPHNQAQNMRAARIYVGETNVPVYAVTGPLSNDISNTYNGIDSGCIVCPNNGEEGRFTAMGNVCYVDTWAASRDGSASTAALKFMNTAGHTRAALAVGFEPNRIILNSNLTAGKHTATIYIAHKGFTNIKDKFFVEYHTKDGTVSTLTEGVLLDDTSTWTGIASGYEIQKIVCPITISEDGELSATLYFRGYSSNELFVDPSIVVE